MASEYKGYYISAWARGTMHGSGCASIGTVCKTNPSGSIIEVKRFGGRSFDSEEEAEQYGFEVCKEWVDKKCRA